jgi:hypothetical protein
MNWNGTNCANLLEMFSVNHIVIKKRHAHFILNTMFVSYSPKFCFFFCKFVVVGFDFYVPLK